jgi:hypothetical protein
MPEIKMHERVASLETSVEEIKTNHLPHLQMGIDKVEAKTAKTYALLWTLTLAIVTGLLGIIATLLSAHFPVK